MDSGISVAGQTALADVPWPDVVQEWFSECREASRSDVHRVPLSALHGWQVEPRTGNLVHRSGKFFTVEGLDVRTNSGPVSHWQQPILYQPEIGILGILVRRVAGELHCLMQAKMEPGNVNGVQISPTVQATRSNYTRVHGGSSTPYLDYFVRPRRGTVLIDVLQSEQGSWFLGKRNRNVVVEVPEQTPAQGSFCWIPVADVKKLLHIDNVINMDARAVLSCLGAVSWPTRAGVDSNNVGDFEVLLQRSFESLSRPKHSDVEVVSWLTERRSLQRTDIRRMPMKVVRDWHQTDDEIAHAHRRHFSIIGIDVRLSDREVSGWSQPMLLPRGRGLVAFFTKPINDVLHVLVRAVTQPGLRDNPEMGPTVQCRPKNYAHLPREQRPPFLDAVLSARPEQIRYDSILSEEGGRFYHAENRYLVVEAEDAVPVEPPDGFLWITVRQLTLLLRHSHYINVEARSLLACLHSMVGNVP